MAEEIKWKWTHNIRKLLDYQSQAMQRKMYFEFNYLQFDEDKKDFYKLMDKQDYKGILDLARELDGELQQGNAIDLKEVFAKPERFGGDDLLDENDEYAVVYNNRVSGNITLYRKISEFEVRKLLNNDITGRVNDAYSPDVNNVRMKMLEEFASSVNDDNRFLKIIYHQQEDALSISFTSYDGNEYEVMRRNYDPNLTVGENIQATCEEYKDRYNALTEVPQGISVKEEESVDETEDKDKTKKIAGLIDNDDNIGQDNDDENEKEDEKLVYEETQKQKRTRGLSR